MQQDNASHWAILAMLRFLLAMIVVATHLVWFIPTAPDWLQFAWELDGKAAVIGFLLVSGYSIHASLSLREDGFIKRRFLRVYPLYFTTVAMTIALEIWQGGEVSAPHHHFQTEGAIAAIGNLLLLQMFLVKTIAFNGPLWSISIEFFYYLCADKIRKYGFLAGAVVALSLICFILPRRDDLGLAYMLLTKLTVLTYAWPWIAGFFLWHKRSVLVMFALTAGAFAVAFSPFYISGRFALLTYLMSIFIILVSPRAKLPARMSKVLNYLGDISYPLYLVHLPVFITIQVTVGATSPAVYGVAAALTAVALLLIIDKYLMKKFFIGWVNSVVTIGNELLSKRNSCNAKSSV
jgi:peptidoglycan/LPS O-acetylase OafA/YrhL